MAKKKKQTEHSVIENQEEKKEEQIEEKKEEQIEEQIDEKTRILLSFKNFMETTVKTTFRTSSDNGYRILEYYNKYTGRQERWTGCASCISGKFQYMLGECKRKNISINI